MVQAVDSICLATLDLSNHRQVADFLQLYHAVFPEWDRETDETVLARHLSGQYLSRIVYQRQRACGFYTINPTPEYEYTSLNFLGVSGCSRSNGLGVRLIEDVKERFRASCDGIRFVLVEASQKVSPFYARNGFSYLDVRYRCPRFDGSEVMDENNLFIYGHQLSEQLPISILGPAIRHILSFGYGMDLDDPSLSQCLEWDKRMIPITSYEE